MSQSGKYKRFTSYPVRLCDVVKGVFDASAKELQTIYGNVKKVLFISTITKKNFQEENSRCFFTLDDGTAKVSASWFDVDEDVVGDFETGDIVMVSARVNRYKENINVNVNKMRKIQNYNEELYHRAIILKKLSALQEQGKPLVLENGGNIINDEQEADVISELFENTPILDSSDEKNGGSQDQYNLDEFKPTSGSDLEDGIKFEDQFIKESIIEALFDLDNDDGVTIDDLLGKLGYERPLLAKTLNEMVNERMVKKVSSNPDRYSPN
ncbi:MAG: OB-fold nucleic acid binding domain-containing protein [Candidatus Hodarchaeota archaeon]